VSIAARVPLPRAEGSVYRGDRRAPWLMLAPVLLFLLALAIAPIVYVVFYSLHRKNLFQNTPAQWVGLDNFKFLFEDANFVTSIVKMIELAGVALAIEMVGGFLLAALIFRVRDLPGMGVVRTILTTPILLAPIVTAFMWRFMYQPDFGVINYLFGKLGLPTSDWLADPQKALWSIAAIDIWQWTPFVFLVILAGMYGLPRQLYEAAELDGTKLVRQALFITIPLLKRVLLIVMLLRMIDLLRVFDIIVGTTSGGPGNATATLPITVWVTAYQEYQIGDAAAESLILLAIIAVVITFFVRLTARQGFVGVEAGR
jgi:multiple sugar transport system permease protein